MFNFNIDFAAECVKTISDNTQCVTCDKLSGLCVRFPCGHSVCEGCAERAGECLVCVSSPGSYIVDKPQTARLNNASALLTAFQDSFKIDVCRRQRISDHLKLEKQVFPECIQAPQKYCNKRKSLNNSHKNKENINHTIFPGEEVINKETAKMKKSFQYVQNWLNQHESVPQNLPRKPFGDININSQPFLHKGKKHNLKLRKQRTQMKAKESTYVKKTHFKSINNSSPLMIKLDKQHLQNDVGLVSKTDNKVLKLEESNTKYKCDQNESGIVIDDEAVIVEDTEEEIIDKDKLAFMAVLEAAKRDEKEDNQILSQSVLQYNISNHQVDINKDHSVKLTVNKSDDTTVNGSKEVLFFKKYFLSDPCKLCSSYSNQNHKAGDDDVSIVINNSAFVTTIKFKHCDQYKNDMLNKKSVAIQTLSPQSEINSGRENVSRQKRNISVNDDIIPTKITRPDVAFHSLDVFSISRKDECRKLENNEYTDVVQNICNDSLKHFKSVIIEDSDTESNISEDNMYKVVADVHTNNAPETVRRGILTSLPQTDLQGGSNRPLRGHTPNSTDSSDKENLDPNRLKQAKFEKKQKQKINK